MVNKNDIREEHKEVYKFLSKELGCNIEHVDDLIYLEFDMCVEKFIEYFIKQDGSGNYYSEI